MKNKDNIVMTKDMREAEELLQKLTNKEKANFTEFWKKHENQMRLNKVAIPEFLKQAIRDNNKEMFVFLWEKSKEKNISLGRAITPVKTKNKGLKKDLGKEGGLVSELVLVAVVSNNSRFIDYLSQKIGYKEVINEGTIKFSNEKEVVASFNFKGQEYTTEKSIVLLEIYLKDNIWRSNIIASGFNGGLGDILRNYGGEEAKPEEKIEPVIVNATPKEVKKEIPKNEETEQIKVNKGFLEKKKKVETIVLEKAPHLIDLTKKVTVTLEKKNLQNVVARVVVVLDRSGSMYEQYRNGDIQKAMDKLLPIALMFDDDGQLDTWAFSEKSIHLSEISLDNIKNYLNNEKGGWDKWRIGAINDEPVVMEEIIDMYEDSNDPAYIIFISDGGIYKETHIKRLLIESSSKPIFWQFVGIGGNNYGILEELDTMGGRVVDNANFFDIDNIDSLSDEELYDKLLNEFPSWLKEAKEKNIIGQ